MTTKETLLVILSSIFIAPCLLILGCIGGSLLVDQIQMPEQIEEELPPEPVVAKIQKQVRPTKLNVSEARTLVHGYARNSIAADDVYRNHWVAVRGKIVRVGSDILGTPNVVLDGGEDTFGSVVCSFSKEDNSTLANLYVGNEIIIAGGCRGYAIGSVVIEDCWIYSE